MLFVWVILPYIELLVYGDHQFLFSKKSLYIALVQLSLKAFINACMHACRFQNAQSCTTVQTLLS